MTKLNLNPKRAGSIVNMVQVDVQKLLDFIPYSSNLLWYCMCTVFCMYTVYVYCILLTLNPKPYSRFCDTLFYYVFIIMFTFLTLLTSSGTVCVLYCVCILYSINPKP
jgi:hypothetical protein